MVELETRIASASRPWSTCAIHARTFASPHFRPRRQYRNLQLDAFLKAQGVSDDAVSIANPALFAQLDKLVAGLKPQQWKSATCAGASATRWRLPGQALARCLFRLPRQGAARGTMPAPRWQQALDAINLAAGLMLGREYAARYPRRRRTDSRRRPSPAGSATLARAVEGSTWMGDAAKAEALAKLKDLRIEVGTEARPRLQRANRWAAAASAATC